MKSWFTTIFQAIVSLFSSSRTAAPEPPAPPPPVPGFDGIRKDEEERLARDSMKDVDK